MLSLLLGRGVGRLDAGNMFAVNEVTKLKDAGMGDDLILSFINSKEYDYDLSANDILVLQKQGFSPAVINAMLISGRATIRGRIASAGLPVTRARPRLPKTWACSRDPAGRGRSCQETKTSYDSLHDSSPICRSLDFCRGIAWCHRDGR